MPSMERVAVVCLFLFFSTFFASSQAPVLPPALQNCIDLTRASGDACSIESDTMSLIYYRDSSQLPTIEQATAAIARMKSAAQPGENCCAKLQPYVQARCPCDPDYQQILPIGGYSPAYFEGATRILAVACNFDFPPCVPGAPNWSPPGSEPPDQQPGVQPGGRKLLTSN